VGDNKVRPVDIRVISATTRDLGQAVEECRFRRDLYYRLKGALIRVPSLRERRGDIDVLLDHFLSIQSEACCREIGLSEEARQRLGEYAWPGNVRELKSTVEALAVSVGDEGEISLGLVERFMQSWQSGSGLDARVKAIEREEIERALSACSGNKSKAARMLGITRRALYSKLKRDRKR
jgi:DNA-binding NtrC family response regulator